MKGLAKRTGPAELHSANARPFFSKASGPETETPPFFKPQTAPAVPGLQAESEEEGKPLQAKAAGEGEAPSSVRQGIGQTQGAGQAMAPALRENMEHAFGHDFSDVHLHTGDSAQAMNRDLKAKAFTHGHNVFFNEGEFNANSREGRHLLAHELAHVAQQGHALAKGESLDAQRPRSTGTLRRRGSHLSNGAEDVVQLQPQLSGQPENREARLHRQAGTITDVLSNVVVRADARGDAGVTVTIQHTGEELIPGFVTHDLPHYQRPTNMTVAAEPVIAGELRPLLKIILLSGAGEWRLHFERHGTGPMRLRRTEAVASGTPVPGPKQNELEEIEVRGVSCSCDAATEQAYDDETYLFIRSIAPLVRSCAQARGLPVVAVAGAIADEYDTRRAPRSAVDAIQDVLIDALPEFAIDVHRFLDIHCKLLNALENDIGAANIKVRTALELVQRGELAVPGSRPSDIQVKRIVDFLLTLRGTVEATATVIARAQQLFAPYLTEHGEELTEAVLVEYFKQGDGYYQRFISRVVANQAHKVCPGEDGCQVWYNRASLLNALNAT